VKGGKYGNSALATYNKNMTRIKINKCVPRKAGNIKVLKRLRTHEKVEIKYRKPPHNLSYREAHKKALKAEHRGLSQHGISVYEGTLGATARHRPMKTSKRS
jgi:16S rRNA G966 N2-methylase RsmD